MTAEHRCTEKERLARIEENQQKTHKKLFESNGERALVELVRDNAQSIKRLTKVVEDHIAQTPVSEQPVKTTKELRLGKGGLSLKGYTGADLLKIALMVGNIAIIIVAAVFIFVVFEGPERLKRLTDKPPAEETTP